jgi:trimethylamine--corrinoid protein Co-methyltransferase
LNPQLIQCDYFKVLTQEGVEAIHNASIAVLEKTGVTLQHPEGLKLLESAGASIDWDSKRARIPEVLVEKCLSSVPSQISLAARNPQERPDR